MTMCPGSDAERLAEAGAEATAEEPEGLHFRSCYKPKIARLGHHNEARRTCSHEIQWRLIQLVRRMTNVQLFQSNSSNTRIATTISPSAEKAVSCPCEDAALMHLRCLGIPNDAAARASLSTIVSGCSCRSGKCFRVLRSRADNCLTTLSERFLGVVPPQPEPGPATY
jgi:hypothetical protein